MNIDNNNLMMNNLEKDENMMDLQMSAMDQMHTQQNLSFNQLQDDQRKSSKGSKQKKESSDCDSSLKTIDQDKNKKLVIIEESQTRYTGRLKFFDEAKNYGFIVMDEDNSDIFVHFDDIAKANITKEYLRTTKLGNVINFSFACMTYIGKYDRSRKAVDLMLQAPNQLNYNQIIMNNVNMFLQGTQVNLNN